MTGARASGLFAVLVLVAALAGSAAQRAAAAFPGIDGKIAFVRGGDIYVINPDGSGETQLTSGDDFDFSPAWSPDGQRVAFSRNGDISVMNADGTNMRAITSGDAFDVGPTWAPEGTRIAFERDGNILVVNDDGSGLANLVNDGRSRDPAWSPDGTQLAFTTRRDDVGTVEDGGEIYTIDVATSAVQRLTNNAGDDAAPGPADRSASWAPDGERIAFHSSRATTNRRSRIYLMTAQGAGETLLATDPLISSEPSWSPDGESIAFAGFDESTSTGGLYVATATGVRLLTPGPVIGPDWGGLADTDGDALADEWETTALDLDGDGTVDLDLPAMGADPNHKDMFIEVDAMPGHELDQAAIDLVIASFAAAPVPNPDGTTGIRLHVDNGPSSPMNPVTGATWGSLSDSDTISHVAVLGSPAGANDYDWAEFDTRKAINFQSSRARAFHYVISAHRYESATNDSSGLSRGIGAADFIVSLGPACPPPVAECSGTVAQQAGTFMHELGHNLGLRHGGQDGLNQKPNYFSVMNYLFQFSGLVSQLGTQGEFDYSSFGPGSIRILDENALDETVGFGGAVPASLPYYTWYSCPGGQTRTERPADRVQIDWNCDGSFGGVFAVDISGEDGLGVLRPYEDWPNLVYGGGAIGNIAGAAVPSVTPLIEPSVAKILESAELLTGGGSDDVPPVTSASTAPSPNAAGWHRDTAIVQLSAEDDGSGVRELVYSLGGAETTVPGATVSIAVAAEGTTTLSYYARDAAGNAEAPQTLVVRIDRTAPDAALRWSTGARDLVVEGEDALSGTMAVTTTIAAAKKHRSLRRYVVTDRAGNSRALDVLVREHGDDRLVAELPGAQLDVRQRLDKAGGLRALDQKAIAGLRRVDADFDGKDDRTTITERRAGERKQRFDRPGLALLTLRVGAAGVAIVY